MSRVFIEINMELGSKTLILVIKSKFKGFLEFETLTLFPYERNLININELSVTQNKMAE